MTKKKKPKRRRKDSATDTDVVTRSALVRVRAERTNEDVYQVMLDRRWVIAEMGSPSLAKAMARMLDRAIVTRQLDVLSATLLVQRFLEDLPAHERGPWWRN